MRSAAGHATSPNAGPPQQSLWALESCMPHFTSRGTEGEVSSVDRWLTKGREFFLLFGDQIRLAAPLILGCEQGRLIMNGLQPDGPSPFCPRFARRKPASFRQTHLSLAGICNHVCEILVYASQKGGPAQPPNILRSSVNFISFEQIFNWEVRLPHEGVKLIVRFNEKPRRLQIGFECPDGYSGRIFARPQPVAIHNLLRDP